MLVEKPKGEKGQCSLCYLHNAVAYTRHHQQLQPRQHEDTVVLTCRFETWDVFYMYSVNLSGLPQQRGAGPVQGNRTPVFNVTRHDTGLYVREPGIQNVTHDDPSTQNGLCE